MGRVERDLERWVRKVFYGVKKVFGRVYFFNWGKYEVWWRLFFQLVAYKLYY
jgi:hypothetical protein